MYVDTNRFHFNELYKFELYTSGGKNSNAEVFTELIIAEDRGYTLEVLVASVAGTDKEIHNMKWLMQNSKEGRIRRAEGPIAEQGQLHRKARAHYKKDRYDVFDVKVEDMTHALFVSKSAKPSIKERHEWDAQQEAKIQAGQRPDSVPENLAELILAWDGDYVTQIYKILNDRYGTPIHEDWKHYVAEVLLEEKLYTPLSVFTFGDENPVQAGLLKVTERDLEQIITEGIASYEINFAIEEDPSVVPVLDQCESLDMYLNHFAGELGTAIQKNIKLRFDPKVDKHHRRFYDVNLAANEQGITGLFPPQADTVMGVANTLAEDNFAFVIGEMGVGKTVIGDVAPYIAQSVITEGKHAPGRSTKIKMARKRLKEEGRIIVRNDRNEIIDAGINSKGFMDALSVWLQNKENEDLYKFYIQTARIRNIQPLEPFRTIIFSPNIMVEKWKREVKERVPHCEVYEITSWQDVMAMYNRTTYMHTKSNGKEVRRFRKPDKIEYYVINSDLPKFTFPTVPMPDYRYGTEEVKAQLALYREQMAQYETDMAIYHSRRAASPDALLTVPEKPKAPRSRFIKDEIENVYTKKISVQLSTTETGMHCPSCGGVLWEKKDVPGGQHFYETRSGGKWNPKIKDLNYKCKNLVKTSHLPKSMVKDPSMEEQECGYILWQPSKEIALDMVSPGARQMDSNREPAWKKKVSGFRKISPIWLLNRLFPRGFFKFLVADEVHEYKAGDSKIGQAFGQLINHTEKQILLTGTLMGGMAEDVFYLLAKLDPKRLSKESISYKDASLFTQRYGIYEKKFSDNNASGNMRQTSSSKKPGVSPHLFPMHLMRNCAFLELADLGYALPPYQEIPIGVQMDSRHAAAYRDIESTVGSMMRQNAHLGGIRYISTYINAMYQYADAPFNMPKITCEDETGNEVILSEPVQFDEETFDSPKFRELESLLNDEIYGQKRKVLVYVKYTGKSASTQMDTYLYEKLKERGYNVGILKSNGSYDGISMPKKAKDREQWVKDMMEKHDWDVLITNPKLVKVGLDLLQFPNIVYYQMDYSTFDYMQSSRRSWRIKQTENVRVYTFFMADTIQQNVLEHIAKKIDAAMAMQGKFSEEGLRAMADTNDGVAALAKNLLKEGKLDEVDTIHERFQRLNHTYEELQSAKYEDYTHYVVNPIEGGMQTVKAIAQGMIREIEHKVHTGVATSEELIAYMEKFDEMMQVVEDVKAYNKGLKKKDQAKEGQLVLDFF